MRRLARNLISLALTAAATTVASAQSFNIDCLNTFGNPTNAYGAAAGQPGFWTNVDAFGGAPAQALSDISGAATAATMDANVGFNFSFNNAATLGDDEALMDDTQCSAGTTTWTIAGLAAGDYKVCAYAWAPDNPVGFITGVTVTGGANGTQNCGGAAWTGGHVVGVTHVLDQVNGVLAGGSVTITFSVGSGFGTINGLQLTKLPSTPPPTPYCTSGTSTNLCQPTISATNNPSITLAAPCVININGVDGQKNGIIYYGLVPNPTGSIWCATGTSLLCVKAPTQRSATQNSGGTPALCNGTLTLDWDLYQSTHPFALGQPWLAGATAHVQGWYRDPPACKTTQLTQAITLTYVP